MTKAKSEKSSVSSSTKVKTQSTLQKKKWDSKRNLAEKRLQNLTQTQTMNKNADSDKAIVPFTSSQLEVKTTSGGSVGVPKSALERAKEIQENLPEFPSCLKIMLPSHVSGGFWLSLPSDFCTRHMPRDDAFVFLVDEYEENFKTRYLVSKNGLSGGWRAFSIAKKLVKGDVVIFQLVETLKLKVYIVRSTRLTELDGAVSLLSLDNHTIAEPIDTDDEPKVKELPSETENLIMYEDHPLLPSSKVANTLKLIAAYDPATDKSDIDSDNDSDTYSGTEMVEGIRFSQSVVKFKDVKKFEDFTIEVDGLILDSEFKTPIRKKYYELCSSQDRFLHENLAKGMNCNLVTGVISETVNISDGIRGAAKSAESVTYLESWDRVLKAFEDLGMAVGFLRNRIRKLINLYQESQDGLDLKQIELDEAENERRCIEENLRSATAKVNRLGSEYQDLKEKADEMDCEFMEVAGASW